MLGLADREPPQIILLAYDAPPTVGGIQTHFAGLARGLVENDVPVLALAPWVEGCEDSDRHFPCPVLRVGDLRKGRFAISLARRLRRLARQLAPPRMVISVNTLPAGLAHPMARLGRWSPLGITGHSTEFMPQSGSFVRGLLLRWVIRSARLCFAVSSYTAENFRKAGVADERIALVYNGIDVERLLSCPARPDTIRRRLAIPPDAKILLTVARLIPRKGHEVVLWAMPEILRHVPEAFYVIAGEGPLRQELERMAAELGIADRVRFAGRVPDDDLPSYYAACDLFVMVPRQVPGEMPEGFGIVYLEAALFEKPSVGSRHGGVPDAIVDGETGVLVPPSDPQATARAVIDLLSNPQAAAAMGRAAKRRALRDFTWKAVARRYLEAIEAAGL